MANSPMSIHAQVLGIPELKAKFLALEEHTQEEYLVTATESGADVITNAVRNNIQTQNLIRTRQLSRSVHQEVRERSPQRVVIGVGTNLEYAAIHEYGGTIQAKNGKYLTIPVNGASGSPRQRSDLKLRKTGGGTLLLVDPAGTPQYILKTSVKIPAQPYMRPALDEHGDEAQNRIGKALAILIEQAAGS